MRPPAEQLIRDYLNRLSVAARNRLLPEDRRAFLVRTNDYIERQSGVRGTADPAEVMRILSGIGEPEAVVERERARIEARRSEREAAARRAVLWKPRRQEQPPAPEPDNPQVTNKDGRPLTGEIRVTSRPITSRWRPGEQLKPRPSRSGRVPRPRRDGSGSPGGTGATTPGPKPADRPAAPAAGSAGTAPAGGAGTVAAGGAQTGQSPASRGGTGLGQPAGPSASAGLPSAAGAASPSQNGGHAGSNGTSPAPQQPPAAAASQSARAVRPGVPGAAPLAPQAPEAPEAGNGVPAVPKPAGRTVRITPGRTVRITRVGRPATNRGPRQRLQPGDVTRDIARRAADVGRRHRMESASVLLMIIAGLIYPYPIWAVGFVLWLIGAGLVMM
jgi:hypothetical protein